MADARRISAAAAVIVVVSTAAVSSVAAPRVDCVMLHAQTTHDEHSSTLLRVELPSGSSSTVRRLGYRVNAMGYAADQDLVYGIGNKRRLVTIDRRGAITDKGPLRLHDPTAGAVSRNRLFVRDGRHLYTIDIDPRSASYRSVVRVVHLWPAYLADSVDDFDIGPGGWLYGVAMSRSLLGLFPGPARVVSIDPVRGKVRIFSTLSQLPRRTSFTSVVIASVRTMYAMHAGSGRLFRIRLDRSDEVTELASLPAASSSDAAGCLRPAPTRPPTTRPPTTRPPTTRPPTTRPPTTRPPTARPPTNRPPTTEPPTTQPPTTQRPTGPPDGRPPFTRPPTQTAPGSRETVTVTVTVTAAPSSPGPSTPIRTSPTPTGPPALGRFGPPGSAAAGTEPDDTVAVLRSWSLATMVLVLAAGAVAAAHARARGRR